MTAPDPASDPQPAAHILVVDDDERIRSLLRRFLMRNGFLVTTARDAAHARRLLDGLDFDLIVLDVMMPGEDGFSLCRHIVGTTQVPVILLTARVAEADRIAGIELGADDYVLKPFSLRELVARIRGVLRRVPPVQPAPDRARYQFGGLVFDAARNSILHADGRETSLTTGESRLLSTLLGRPEETHTRTLLLDLVRSRQLKANDRTIDNLVSRLRRKLGDDPGRPRLIITEWGGGYRIGVPVAAAG